MATNIRIHLIHQTHNITISEIHKQEEQQQELSPKCIQLGTY